MSNDRASVVALSPVRFAISLWTRESAPIAPSTARASCWNSAASARSALTTRNDVGSVSASARYSSRLRPAPHSSANTGKPPIVT